jgi:uncharacterized membrane protein SirB2
MVKSLCLIVALLLSLYAVVAYTAFTRKENATMQLRVVAAIPVLADTFLFFIY